LDVARASEGELDLAPEEFLEAISGLEEHAFEERALTSAVERER
jgi:hypothetical protein